MPPRDSHLCCTGWVSRAQRRACLAYSSSRGFGRRFEVTRTIPRNRRSAACTSKLLFTFSFPGGLQYMVQFIREGTIRLCACFSWVPADQTRSQGCAKSPAIMGASRQGRARRTYYSFMYYCVLASPGAREEAAIPRAQSSGHQPRMQWIDDEEKLGQTLGE